MQNWLVPHTILPIRHIRIHTRNQASPSHAISLIHTPECRENSHLCTQTRDRVVLNSRPVQHDDHPCILVRTHCRGLAHWRIVHVADTHSHNSGCRTRKRPITHRILKRRIRNAPHIRNRLKNNKLVRITNHCIRRRNLRSQCATISRLIDAPRRRKTRDRIHK